MSASNSLLREEEGADFKLQESATVCLKNVAKISVRKPLQGCFL